MLANLVWPFPGKGYALFLILLLILVAVHLLQLLMFRTVYASQLQWRAGDAWQIVAFGVVGWMAILQAQAQRQSNPPQR
jgi:putative membrane protein